MIRAADAFLQALIRISASTRLSFTSPDPHPTINTSSPRTEVAISTLLFHGNFHGSVGCKFGTGTTTECIGEYRGKARGWSADWGRDGLRCLLVCKLSYPARLDLYVSASIAVHTKKFGQLLSFTKLFWIARTRQTCTRKSTEPVPWHNHATSTASNSAAPPETAPEKKPRHIICALSTSHPSIPSRLNFR